MTRTKRVITLVSLALAACSTPGPHWPQWQVAPVQSVRDGGGSAGGWYALGRLQLAEGRIGPAETALRRALELDPHHAAAHSALGVLLARRGDLEGAISAFQSAVGEGATAAGYNNLGYALYLQGRHDAAAEALAKASALDPGNGRIWHNLGLALEKSGAVERARLAFGHAAELTGRAGAPAVADAKPAPIVSVSGAGDALVELAPGLFEIRGSAAGAVAAPAAPGSPASYRLEIVNGNGVPGLARRVGARLAAAGLPSAHLRNQKPYVQQVTEIQYRQGHAVAAGQVGARLPGITRLSPLGKADGRADVRLVLGRDLRDPAGQTAAIPAPRPEAGAPGKSG